MHHKHDLSNKCKKQNSKHLLFPQSKKGASQTHTQKYEFST